MEIKFDGHNHLATFENIGNNFNKVIDYASKMLGKEGLFAIVNAQDKGIGRYETFIGLKGYGREIKDNFMYVPEKEIYVIKGQEIFTGKDKPSGHILVLGLDEKNKLNDRKSLEDSFKEAQDKEGIIIADHGFFLDGIFSLHDEYKYLGYLDGIEVHNGESWLPVPGYLKANANAQQFYNEIKENYNLGALCFSDGHSYREIGSSYSLIEKPNFSSPDKMRNSLRKSIRQHKNFSEDKMKNSIISTLDHTLKVMFLLRLKDKLTGKRESN